jgi:hypothetical protein
MTQVQRPDSVAQPTLWLIAGRGVGFPFFKFSRPSVLNLMKVKMLKINDHNHKNLYPTQLTRLPKKKGIIIPGRRIIMNTLKTSITQNT